ncbi:hypothetical protein [Paenibacillus sp. NPDC058174]|uniref:hypothetical protein n=1 Tax=Paenibacillus sp. NPDC058174 TaxID=3346366 RepID=UPI0036D7DF9B
MSEFGLIIRKLVLQGIGKRDAILTFNDGLNIIAGASDTGKSFAFGCINYILGGSELPEKPEESIGYNNVLLEFIDKKSKQIITLKRSLNENEKTNIFMYHSDIDHIDDVSENVLSSDSKAKKSLSSKLLSLIDCRYENVLKSTTKGETEAFTFRKFVPLMMLNESRIVQSNSAVFLGDTTRDAKSTKETATFFTLLTGNDYKKYVKSESVEVKKAQLRGRIEELTFLSNELRVEISRLEESLEEKSVGNVDRRIKEIELLIKENKAQVEEQENKHRLLIDEYRVLSNEKARIKDNLIKFRMLKKNYESDIERLDFIDQSHNYIDQLTDIICPVCSTQIENENQPKEIYYIAINKEKQKLNSHLSDLDETISDFEDDLLENDVLMQKKQTSINELEGLLRTQSTFISSEISDYEKYLKVRDHVIDVQKGKNKLSEMNARIIKLNATIEKTKSNVSKAEINKLSDELLIEFCSIIEMFLEKWSFINDKDDVQFNNKKTDVIVAGKTKASYGKGARAIINSAFILAIMDYCTNRGLPHPGFVILDSPLTTYKERDKIQNAKNEDVNTSVKESFFKHLAKYSNKYQVIILDNELPPSDLKDITYHHLTGNKEIERTGFIPN